MFYSAVWAISLVLKEQTYKLFFFEILTKGSYSHVWPIRFHFKIFPLSSILPDCVQLMTTQHLIIFLVYIPRSFTMRQTFHWSFFTVVLNQTMINNNCPFHKMTMCRFRGFISQQRHLCTHLIPEKDATKWQGGGGSHTAGLEKSAFQLSGTSRFTCRASHFSFSLAQWASHLLTKS